jgi:hypothetical protein
MFPKLSDEAIIVAEASSTSAISHVTAPETNISAYSTSTANAPVAFVPLTFTNRIIIRTTYLSAPSKGTPALAFDYRDLGNALKEMAEADDDDDWKIGEGVYDIASSFAEMLLAASCPAPRLLSHSPQTVVFNWCQNAKNYYLTFSPNGVSALMSTPENIQARKDWSTKELSASVVDLLLAGANYPKPSLRRLTAGTDVNSEDVAV